MQTVMSASAAANGLRRASVQLACSRPARSACSGVVHLLLATAILAGIMATAVPMAARAATVTTTELLQAILGNLTPNPAAPTPATMQDLGPATPTATLSITVYLKSSNPAGLAAFVAAVQTPSDPNFHQFLGLSAFVQRFAPTGSTLGFVETALQSNGLTINKVFANQLALRVTGTVADIDATFGLTLHTFTGGGHGYASTTQTVFLPALAGLLESVGGFDTVIPSTPGPTTTTTRTTDLELTNTALAPALTASSGVTDAPGRLTPMDYEKLYDVEPLMQAGATGAGRTVAIVTEQNFNPADPQTFWQTIGVSRTGSFQTQFIDGADADTIVSADESDLDTEQAGSIAPGATLIAYVTPVGASGLLDGYEQVASDNKADVVSSSFGTPEFYFGSNGTEIFNSTLLPAFNDVFMELAAQGETVFAAAGDAGAFDINRNEAGYYEIFPTVGGPVAYTPVYSVNAIAANPLVTAAGGTTLPITGTDNAVSPPFNVSIAQEQPWSTSYLPLASLRQNDDLAQATTLFELAFPSGGGGGVSTIWPIPAYQRGLDGIVTTKPAQALIQLGGTPAVLDSPPAKFAGRNLPDLCANADPRSGYLHLTDGTMLHDGGGTSFIAPQFAGTLAVIDSALGHRVGQLNPLLYTLQATGMTPAHDITSGDNWGYTAHVGYDQTTGLGVMDADKLYQGLKSFD